MSQISTNHSMRQLYILIYTTNCSCKHWTTSAYLTLESKGHYAHVIIRVKCDEKPTTAFFLLLFFLNLPFFHGLLILSIRLRLIRLAPIRILIFSYICQRLDLKSVSNIYTVHFIIKVTSHAH